MKKTILMGALIAATLSPIAAQAQNRWNDRQEVRQDQREMRQDRRELQRDRRDWRDARRDWRSDRRDDRREDWQRYRDSNRDAFRRGAWRAPFAYRSFGIGAVVPRSYWGSRYYVNNWSNYRLPAPGYAYYRYVRHFDDLLLINTRNGRVVRVYHNFYW